MPTQNYVAAASVRRRYYYALYVQLMKMGCRLPLESAN